MARFQHLIRFHGSAEVFRNLCVTPKKVAQQPLPMRDRQGTVKTEKLQVTRVLARAINRGLDPLKVRFDRINPNSTVEVGYGGFEFRKLRMGVTAPEPVFLEPARRIFDQLLDL